MVSFWVWVKCHPVEDIPEMTEALDENGEAFSSGVVLFLLHDLLRWVILETDHSSMFIIISVVNELHPNSTAYRSLFRIILLRSILMGLRENLFGDHILFFFKNSHD